MRRFPVFVTSGGEEGKLAGIVRALPSIWTGRLLDVGCRSRTLWALLSTSDVRYVGLDLKLPADIIGDLDAGLPFANESFDVVLALDVLEHTDKIHKAFGELCRVARQYVVVTLPNGYDVRSRVRFLLGRPLSGKYGLPHEPHADRHRWLFSFSEAMAFVRSRAGGAGFRTLVEGCLIGPRRKFLLSALAVSLWPDLLSPWYLAVVTRSSAQSNRR